MTCAFEAWLSVVSSIQPLAFASISVPSLEDATGEINPTNLLAFSGRLPQCVTQAAAQSL